MKNSPFQLFPTKIAGCYEISPQISEDNRGRFVKTFDKQNFISNGLESEFCEDFYTTSKYGVIRGLHFQSPPSDHAKLVYCSDGLIFDVVLDLRVGSKTYGEFEVFELGGIKANALYIPRGLAHGFCVLSDSATVAYKVSSHYSPMYDGGILWDSVGIDWPVKSPIISSRDQTFPALAEYKSPFSI